MGKAMRCFTFFWGGEEGERVQLFYLVSCDSCDFWVISSEKAEWVTCLCFWWIWIGCCFSYHLLLNLFASTPEMPQYWFSLHDLLFVSFIWVDGLTRQTTGTSPPTPKTHRQPTNNRNNKQQTITNQHYPPYNPKHHIGSWKFQWFFFWGKMIHFTPLLGMPWKIRWQNFCKLVFSGRFAKPSGATQFCWASHKTFGTKGHTNLGRGGAERWPSWGRLKGWKGRSSNHLEEFTGILQPLAHWHNRRVLLVYYLIFFLGGGRNKPISRLICFLWRKELVFLKVLPPLRPI